MFPIDCFSATGAVGRDAGTETQLRQFKEANDQLQRQLLKQQELIEALSTKVARLEGEENKRAGEWQSLKGEIKDRVPEASDGPKLSARGKVNFSGQVAAGFFKTGSDGVSPNNEFHVDEARLFLDAKAWEDVYGFVELNVMTRESYDDGVRIGEAYIDLERVLKLRGLDSLLNVRVGRFYIPFGEEYAARNPIDDPLISHSLTDLWGVDEGIELYGSHGPVSYAVAVQNGGHPATGDFTSDKSVAARLAYEPRKWLRLSGSVMRTGDLSPTDDGDGVSEMWFGNGFFSSLGNAATTTKFHAELAEGDVQFLFPRGHLKLAGGGIHYDDDDRSADNSRDVYYYSAEGMFRFTKKFYGAGRASQIFANQGFPILGNGNWSKYGAELTDHLWRLSLGLGYTPNPNLVLKIEYALERGHTVGGERREHEDFFGVQAALRF